jgi:hypothetical protein
MFVSFFSHPPLSSAQASEIKNLKSLTVELMPEFDKKGVLVILKGELTSNTTFPATLRVHLPAKININAVAFRDKATGKLFLGEYTIEEKENHSLLTHTARTDNFWVEFYTDDAFIVRDGDRRNFVYTWDENFSVDQLVWHVQKPHNAVDFNVKPEGGEMIPGSYGIPTYRLVLDKLPAGQPLQIIAAYVKSDDTFTSSVLISRDDSADKRQSRGESQRSHGSKKNYLSTILFVIIVVVIVIGFIFLWPKKSEEK